MTREQLFTFIKTFPYVSTSLALGLGLFVGGLFL